MPDQEYCPLCKREALTISTISVDYVLIVCTNPDCKKRGERQGIKVKK